MDRLKSDSHNLVNFTANCQWKKSQVDERLWPAEGARIPYFPNCWFKKLKGEKKGGVEGVHSEGGSSEVL